MFLGRFSSQEPIIFVVSHAESLPLFFFCIRNAVILPTVWGFKCIFQTGLANSVLQVFRYKVT